MDMLLGADERAERLLKLGLGRGNEKIKRLPSVFYGKVSGNVLGEMNNNTCYTLLMHFRLSFLCTKYLI